MVLPTVSSSDVTHLFLLQVPQIHWELSTKRVLLMEFVEGGQVNDRAYMEKNRIDVNEVRGQGVAGPACLEPAPLPLKVMLLPGRVLPRFPIHPWAWSRDRDKQASLSLRLLLPSFLTAAKSVQMSEQHRGHSSTPTLRSSANSSEGILTRIRTQALSPPPFLSPSSRPMWVHSRTCSHLLAADQ